ncbi:glycoside hydrolase family 18 chitinase [Streptomyces albireticuli]|uniref:chitinase n=1 Tax=Streptomyces albireticuli TaxID=1940 RepID=A0A2A2D5S2_9ACTN|nr:glycoside hydrolase family 18 chitinase [Streptomyces albireticuli]MCD9144301.1 glycoside hydrolase family 18 chitinase [Streptomyces albireticuli]MCD9162056.1 glycoside hydrolase family 18 chitinase [Streptomyces albireticuli]MCD9193938.1 glycoside hydrolase family 18 chitinase [Streptomyces albireticuli]PAU46861.1 chitinase [Streptomyces albireticuli]
MSTGISRRSRRPLSRAVALFSALLLPAAALVGLSTASQAASQAPRAAPQAAGATATFAKTSDWGTGYQAEWTVRNTGTTTINSWTVEWDFPSGTTVGAYWDALITSSGTHHTAKNREYNGTIAPGASVTFGFVAAGNGDPTGCKLDGGPCEGSPADTPPSAPGQPSSTGVTASSIALTWAAATDDKGVKNYDVYRGETVVGTVSTTAFTDTGLTADTDYTYKVVARDTAGQTGPASPSATLRTGSGGGTDKPPSAPGTPAATAVTDTTVTLKWPAATDDKGVKNYDVYRGTSKVATVGKLTHKDTGLTAGTDYTYTVVARDSADQTGKASAPLTVRTTGGGTQPPVDRAKVGYFVQWGIYGRGYTVKSLETTGAAAKLTHINYSFSNIHPTNLTCLNGVTKATTPNPQDPNQGDGAGDSWADYEKGFSAGESVDGVGDTWDQKLAGNFNQLKKLKAKHPNLKINMSIGGWTYSKYFSDVAKTDASRQKFVKSCIDMYIKGDLPAAGGRGGAGVAAGIFDGFDLDWEWPGAEGHAGNHVSKDDKANNTLLFAEFRRQLDALSGTTGKKYLLTAFTPADPGKIEAGWDITTKDGTPSVFDYMDFANVQGYDFHGSGSDNSWEPNRTGHQGNLYEDAKDPYTTKFSAEKTVRAYLDAGVDPKKVVLGLAFYGRGWQQVADGGERGVWQTANGAAPGQFPEESGTRGYDNLIASVAGLTVHHDEQSVATYGYTGNNGQWWTFDDVWSINKKTAWLKTKGLGGVMIWEMSGDSGTLMTAVDNGLR